MHSLYRPLHARKTGPVGARCIDSHNKIAAAQRLVRRDAAARSWCEELGPAFADEVGRSPRHVAARSAAAAEDRTQPTQNIAPDRGEPRLCNQLAHLDSN